MSGRQTGTRIEETTALADEIEHRDPQDHSAEGAGQRRRQHRPASVSGINIGLRQFRHDRHARTPTSSSRSSEDHAADRRLRAHHARASCRACFPGVTFSFLPADIVSADPEFRCARRRSTCRSIGQQSRRPTATIANKLLARISACPGRRRRPHPAGVRAADAERRRRPLDGEPGRPERAETRRPACCTTLAGSSQTAPDLLAESRQPACPIRSRSRRRSTGWTRWATCATCR